MKRMALKQQLNLFKTSLVDSIHRWKELNLHGGNDPCWNDGYNMNLVRNHILYYKYQIVELCQEQNWTLPYEYYLPLPPVVPDAYMANKEQTERIKKLLSLNRKVSFEKPQYDNSQLMFSNE